MFVGAGCGGMAVKGATSRFRAHDFSSPRARRDPNRGITADVRRLRGRTLSEGWYEGGRGGRSTQAARRYSWISPSSTSTRLFDGVGCGHRVPLLISTWSSEKDLRGDRLLSHDTPTTRPVVLHPCGRGQPRPRPPRWYTARAGACHSPGRRRGTEAEEGRLAATCLLPFL